MENLIVFAFVLYNFINPSYRTNVDSFFYNKYNIVIEDLNSIHELTEQEKKFVSHAGGKYGEFTYVNNYEALKNSYDRGFRLIELDIEFTSDGYPVMMVLLLLILELKAEGHIHITNLKVLKWFMDGIN